MDTETIDVDSEAKKVFIRCLKKGGASNVKTDIESFMSFELDGRVIELCAVHYNTGESGLEIGIE